VRALAFLLLSSTAFAQIVNVQPLVAKHEMRPGFGIALEGAVDWRTGNVDLLLASGNLIARYRRGRHHLFLLGHAELGVKSGTRFLSKDLEHLRYRIAVVGPLDLETFVQHDRDEFRRVNLRVVWGGGPRLRIIMTRRIECAIAAAYLGEYEEIRQDMQPDAGSTRLMHRISTYGTVVVRLGTRFALSETVYAQPRIGLPQDLRLLEDVELLSSVTDHFSLKVGWSLAYDNVPPIGVVPLDTGVRVMFQLSW
jgi:hypothetical protein